MKSSLIEKINNAAHRMYDCAERLDFLLDEKDDLLSTYRLDTANPEAKKLSIYHLTKISVEIKQLSRDMKMWLEKHKYFRGCRTKIQRLYFWIIEIPVDYKEIEDLLEDCTQGLSEELV